MQLKFQLDELVADAGVPVDVETLTGARRKRKDFECWQKNTRKKTKNRERISKS